MGNLAWYNPSLDLPHLCPMQWFPWPLQVGRC